MIYWGQIDLNSSSLNGVMVRVLGIDYLTCLTFLAVGSNPTDCGLFTKWKELLPPGNMLVIPLEIVNIVWETILGQY